MRAGRAWSPQRLEHVTEEQVLGLAQVLLDCVNSGAAVGFRGPLSEDRAAAYWRSVAADVERGERILLVVEDDDGICGTVQLDLALPDNQPHRADLCKTMVHRRARQSGAATALLRAADKEALRLGRTVLVLDAVTEGDAARLYESLGWQRVGDIPNYAVFPDGSACSTTYYYKDLGTDPYAAPG